MLPALILAGGRGTRLGALTADRPKCMVDVHGEPFIGHQLNLLRSKGVTDVVISTGYRGDQVAEYVGNGRQWGVNAECVSDGPEPLGTGGAVRKAAERLPEAFFVMYGDSYLLCDFGAVVERFDLTRHDVMVVTQNDYTGHERNVEVRDGKVRNYGSGGYIDYGLSVIRKDSVASWAAPFPLRYVFDGRILLGGLEAVETPERFYEIGTPQGLADTSAYLREKGSDHVWKYHERIKDAAGTIFQIGGLVEQLRRLRSRGGRLFILGVGGSAANASHAVCDFRKLCAIEAYCPTDNAAELTARVNDDGWATSLSRWLQGSRLSAKDAVLVLSVGGGNENVSRNLVEAIKAAKAAGAPVLGIVGPNGGYTASAADVCIRVPCADGGLVTPITESFQSVLLHALVTHPDLKRAETKW